MKNLQKIFDDLGLKEGNGLFLLTNDRWKKECNFSSRVNRLIEDKIHPDAFFCFGNKPLILFYDAPENKKAIHKAIWNFNESPIVFIVEDDSVEIFNGFNFIKDKDELEKIGTNGILTDFSYFQLVTGSTWETYQSKLDKKNRVDFNLLNNIKDARTLLDAIIKDQRVTNALIGKIIFIRYLIDREVKIGFEGDRKNWTNDDLIRVLAIREKAIEFLKYLQNKFNGDMFPLEDKDYELISQNCFDILIRLLNEDNLGNEQLSLFKLYDFSIIPIEFVSNVYESFIGEDKQKNEGAYYTPLFLVDYILAETVEKYFDEKYTYNCRVLDPACGSGIFLVETLRKIIERFIEIHPVLAKNPETFKRALHNLAINNIFGVDKNLPAIHVAIFSIQLTLLDYQNPSDIEDFRFPPMLGTNFFESDFFDTIKPFNKILEKIPFDCILGNPPWKGGGMDGKGQLYLKARKEKEKEQKKEYAIAVNNGEIAEGFVLRVSDFAKENTQIALIVRSSILYNLGYKTEFSQFRRYWLQEFFINHVFELAPVRKEIFDQSNNDTAIAPAAILFYKYANGKNTDNSAIKHVTLKPSRFFSLFKVFSISHTDFKKVEQKKLKEHDWLWKTLVYGSYLDFNFIKRLKKGFLSIKDVISDESKFVVGTGIHSRSFKLDEPKDTTSIEKYTFLKTAAIDSMFIDYEKKAILEKEKVDIVKNELLFLNPMLLIREGLDMDNLKTKSAISYQNCVFKDSITSIKALSYDSLKQLKQFNALYSSFVFPYLAVNTFSSIGIERERVKNYNKFSIPYIDCDVADAISEIEKIKEQIHHRKSHTTVDEIEISRLESFVLILMDRIDNTIRRELLIDVENEEAAVINYALDMIRPFIINDENKIKQAYSYISFEDQYLNNYATLFLNRFKPTLDNGKQKFIVDIWHSRHIVGMLFKVVPNIPENSKDIVWIKNDNNLILQSLIKLGSQKITDQLFVQKDIRGFEKDYFYIFKPNEKRLWHQAIGYIDVDEFMDAVLKAGRRGE
jgi:hypothetical protein